MKVQLITFEGCPHADAARESLRRSLVRAGFEPTFEDLDSAAPGTPAALRDWGSPTVLIEGVDVGGEELPTGPCCRVYRDADGRPFGFPSESLLLEAIGLARQAS